MIKKSVNIDDHKYPNFNWSIDLLNKTESFESFIAKFCHLNKITVKKFLQNWNYLYTDKIKFDNFFRHISKNDKDILESYSQFKYAKLDCIESGIQVEKGNNTHKQIFLYCELCMKTGFHSEIFNKNWISICPVHKTKLQKINLLTESSSNKNDYFYSRVEKIKELAISLNLDWPRNKERVSTLRFCKIKNWVVGLEKEIQKYFPITGNIICATNESDINRLLGFFNYVFPINDTDLNFIFRNIKQRPPKVKLYYDKEVLIFIRDYKYEINNILEHYKNKLQADKFNNFKFFEFINNYLNYINKIHCKKKCKWADRKREYYWKISENQFHNNLWTTCQYEQVGYLISANWLDYSLLGHTVVKRILSQEFHYRKINISKKVEKFLEEILFELLINIIFELSNKIKEVQKLQGRKIDLHEIFASNIYLKLEDDKCILVNTVGLSTSDRVTKLVNFQ